MIVSNFHKVHCIVCLLAHRAEDPDPDRRDGGEELFRVVGSIDYSELGLGEDLLDF